VRRIEPTLPVSPALLEEFRESGEVDGNPPGFVAREPVHCGAPARLVLAIEPTHRLAIGVVDAVTAVRLDDGSKERETGVTGVRMRLRLTLAAPTATYDIVGLNAARFSAAAR
jgi:hypothetical protein